MWLPRVRWNNGEKQQIWTMNKLTLPIMEPECGFRKNEMDFAILCDAVCCIENKIQCIWWQVVWCLKSNLNQPFGRCRLHHALADSHVSLTPMHHGELHDSTVLLMSSYVNYVRPLPPESPHNPACLIAASDLVWMQLNSPCSESESVSVLKAPGATGRGLRGRGFGVGGEIHFFPINSTYVPGKSPFCWVVSLKPGSQPISFGLCSSPSVYPRATSAPLLTNSMSPTCKSMSSSLSFL